MIYYPKMYGTCSGANKAIQMAYKLKDEFKDKNVYIYKEILHNQYIIDELSKNGIETIEDYNLLTKDDILIITADHGCDPSTPSTDHSREYVPMLIYGNRVTSGVDLKTRDTFADISATILEYFNVDKEDTAGKSFLKEIIK